ncbi:DNA-binding protein [Colletotrichum sojae]|uniref:DNA-binding protein n=1 Tax=Colletotrichum sojae TaxID=2175907 RepID=A0A8H6JSI3_9PEZI|nr:DNA-binding protein [Colletotrichum sojae]
MLMPSALSCDTSQPPLTRLQAAMFASPPASPPSLSNGGAFGNIFDTCRSLQALLSNHQPQNMHHATQLPSPPPQHQLPTPPLAHAPPPLKLRLRPRAKPSADGSINNDHAPRRRIAKRAPPRGVNKRRRAHDDDMGRDDSLLTDSDDSDLEISSQHAQERHQLPSAPSTPKRARIAPEALPLGLERSDFHTLHNADDASFTAEQAQGSNIEIEADGERWSAEDDRILVELVLEKLKLSKTEWQDCARSLGKDRNCLSRRWKSLMLQGEVGLKGRRSSRRSKIHGTWR